MKTLLFMRHGKSDWTSGESDDHDRPLTKRGRRASASMGRALAALDEVPELVVSSTAVRAHDTVVRAAKAGQWRSPIVTTPILYEATPSAVLAAIRELDAAYARVLLAGHQPTTGEVIGELVGGADIRFPTAAVARIDVEVDTWADVGPGAGTLVWLLAPRMVRRLG